jgi:DNA-binding transcriptional MerR regulator
VAEEKLFYSIGEAAEVVDVKPYVLRYWETEFTKLNPQKTDSGQRTYRKKDLQVALAIKKLLYDEKYTIAGAIQKLEELEKAGLDQLDVPEKKDLESAKAADGRADTAPIEQPRSSVQAHNFPQEKIREMKDLILNTRTLLKKYNVI